MLWASVTPLQSLTNESWSERLSLCPSTKFHLRLHYHLLLQSEVELSCGVFGGPTVGCLSADGARSPRGSQGGRGVRQMCRRAVTPPGNIQVRNVLYVSTRAEGAILGLSHNVDLP